MKKLLLTVSFVATVAFAGAVAWQASAATPAAPVPIAGPYTPIHPAGCGGWGACPPGRHQVCGPYGHNCWCAPC
jgi:hypothetical protein